MFDRNKLEVALHEAWDADTSAADKWSPKNKALGQCAVTACIVQDYLGGDILNTTATLPDTTIDSHYYNFVDDEEVDLTRSQFPKGTSFTEGVPKTKDFDSTRAYILSYRAVNNRYEILKKRVESKLQQL